MPRAAPNRLLRIISQTPNMQWAAFTRRRPIVLGLKQAAALPLSPFLPCLCLFHPLPFPPFYLTFNPFVLTFISISPRTIIHTLPTYLPPVCQNASSSFNPAEQKNSMKTCCI